MTNHAIRITLQLFQHPMLPRTLTMHIMTRNTRHLRQPIHQHILHIPKHMPITDIHRLNHRIRQIHVNGGLEV